MKANRYVYGETLLELAKKDPRIVVVDSDIRSGLGYVDFIQEFPNRYFDCGIAEQNMCSIAVGLASSGLVAFAGTFAVFTSMRALDQVRNGAALYDLNVKFIGSHAGLETGQDGATHQSVEDIAIMRSIPNMKLLAPCCPNQTKALVRLMVDTPGTFYIRFGREKSEVRYSEDTDFLLGGSKVLREGNDVAILTFGRMVDIALEAAEELAKNEGVQCRILDMYSLKPIDVDAIVRAAKETKGIVTVEDHSIIGGLGGAVCEVVCTMCPTRVRRVGVNDCFGRSGTMSDLYALYGLTSDHLQEEVRTMLRNE